MYCYKLKYQRAMFGCWIICDFMPTVLSCLIYDVKQRFDHYNSVKVGINCIKVLFSYVPKVSSNFGTPKPRLDLKRCLEFLLPLILCISVKHNNLLTAHLFSLKNGFCLQVFVIRFISQWMKRSKHHLIVFPPKKNVT